MASEGAIQQRQLACPWNLAFVNLSLDVSVPSTIFTEYLVHDSIHRFPHQCIQDIGQTKKGIYEYKYQEDCK